MLPVFPKPPTNADKQPLSEPIQLVQLDTLLPDQASMSSYPYLSLPYNFSLPTFSRPCSLDSPPLPFGAAAALPPQPCPQASMVADFSASPLVMMSKMRGRRKDRHSKIVTANGPRDRRIRLSREVARSFFDLQEMLGFDHGSKTLQWLLSMSKHAIEGLDSTTGRSTSTTASSPAQIPNLANLFDTSNVIVSDDCQGQFASDADKCANTSKSSIAAPSTMINARESRAKARARAKERATEKKKNNTSSSSSSHAAAVCEKLDHSDLLHLNSSLIEYSMPQFVVEEGCPAAAAISTNFDHDQDGLDDHLIPSFGNWIADHTYNMDYIFQQQDMQMPPPSSLDPFN